VDNYDFSYPWGGVRVIPLSTPAASRPSVRAPDDDECGAIGRIRIARGNRNTSTKPALVLLCPPQIPHDLTEIEHGPPR
jgi:hypothetical protein